MSDTSFSLKHLVPEDVFRRMVELRRDLHRDPELSGHEKRTAERIAQCLDRIGITYRTAVGGHGLVALIPGASGDRSVALRADMDALPILEQTGLPFASMSDGVMHACGHDGHCGMLLGAAELLAAGAPPPAPVRLIFQPAEEDGSGAQAMIEAGVLDDVGIVFGAHLDGHHSPGTLVVDEGAVNAATDRFCIDVRGRQGHGGRPHEALDAVVVASFLVVALQTIVARETDPAQPAVISVGRFEAGAAHNVIAGSARLEGTIRTRCDGVRERLVAAVRRIAGSVGQVHGAGVKVRFDARTPTLVNSPEMTALAREAALQVAAPAAVVPPETANMGGEDFSWYLQHVPGAYIRVGAMVEARESFPAHSSRFDIDESALASGAAWFAAAARLAGDRLVRGEIEPLASAP